MRGHYVEHLNVKLDTRIGLHKHKVVL